MSKYLSSLLGSQNIKSILGTTVSGIKGVSGIEILHLPLGTILMYHGTGILNPTTKSTEISVANGDSFDMKGWYVCNGYTITDYALGDATNLIDKFIRCEMEAGNTGGNKDAPYIAHSHTLISGGGHTHSTGNQSTTHTHSFCDYWSSLGAGGLAPGSAWESYLHKVIEDAVGHYHFGISSGGAHSDHSMSNSGSSDYADKNSPYSRTLIFIERKRIDDYKLPLGTVMMYHGTAISNITTKGSDLSTELKMPGWYVANGVKAGTVNMTDKFSRGKMSVATGTIDGSDNVTLRQHSHTTNANSTHSHTTDTKYHSHGFPYGLGGALWYVGSGGSVTGNTIVSGVLDHHAWTATSYSGDHTHATNNCASHYHAISTEGDNDGVGYNKPAYKTLIFIQKVEA